MPYTSSFFVKTLFVGLLVVLVGMVGQWFPLNWGRVEQAQVATISVTGQAKQNQASQIATFTAGVMVSEVDRDLAVEAVNAQMTDLITDIKAFGIADADIQTNTVSVYEYTEPAEIMPLIYPPRDMGGEQKWQATNSVTVTLRDVSRASELATILTNSSAGVTVSGPNFTLDDTTELDRTLLQEALADAREKADLMLAGTGQKVVRVINVYENDYSMPYAYRESAMVKSDGSAGTPAPVEPGSETVYKTVSVIFEISR
jgi:uncharacterized protein YggE